MSADKRMQKCPCGRWWSWWMLWCPHSLHRLSGNCPADLQETGE